MAQSAAVVLVANHDVLSLILMELLLDSIVCPSKP